VLVEHLALEHERADRFPVVVDSDPDAVGTFVPGTGQEIHSHEGLRGHHVGVVIIPAHRRAAEIVRTMAACDIRCDTVLVEDRGRLVDYVAASSRAVGDAAPALASR